MKTENKDWWMEFLGTVVGLCCMLGLIFGVVSMTVSDSWVREVIGAVYEKITGKEAASE